jgi:hypothetical protein
VGGALGSEQELQVSAHLGLHFANGFCCDTVIMTGYAGELSAAHAFSSSLTGSLGATLYAADDYAGSRFVGEGSARLAVAF